MLTTTPSLPQKVANKHSCPIAILRQMMDAQPKPDSPVSSQPNTQECPSETTWCISAPTSVFSGAASKKPPGEQEEGKGKESGKESEWVEGGW